MSINTIGGNDMWWLVPVKYEDSKDQVPIDPRPGCVWWSFRLIGEVHMLLSTPSYCSQRWWQVRVIHTYTYYHTVRARAERDMPMLWGLKTQKRWWRRRGDNGSGQRRNGKNNRENWSLHLPPLCSSLTTYDATPSPWCGSLAEK